MGKGGSRQDVGEQPSAPRDYVRRTPESGNHVLLPYEELFSVCAKYEGGYYYVGETIGQNRLTNAHLHFPVPDTERIVALIDTSMWMNGKFGLALCEGGIYWNNGWGAPAKTYRASLSWAEFASVSIEFKDEPANILEFGKGNLFWVQKHDIKKEDVLRLFSEVQSLARTYVEETHSDVESLDEAGSRQDLSKQPSTPEEYIHTPGSGNRGVLPYEELFSVCAKYEGDDYYVGEAIGQNRLTNAYMRFPIPDTERVIAIIDTSTWGNSKSGLALCGGGIYWNNGWSPPVKTYRTSLSWAEFASVSIEFKDDPADTVEFGKGSLFWAQKQTIKKDDLSDLFSEVQSLARTYAQELSPRPTSEEPDASSDQPPEVSPLQEPEPPLVAVDNPPNQMASERFGAPSIPANFPLPLAYSYRLADAEFETFRVLKELYRNAEGLTAFLASLALVLAPAPTGKRRDTLLRAWRGKGATFGVLSRSLAATWILNSLCAYL